MKEENFKSKFENFKKEYISERANVIASNFQFVKNVIGAVIKEYTDMFEHYFTKNKDIINDFFKNRDKNLKDGKDKFVLNWLSFICAIPKLLIFNDDDIDINYVFFKKYFFAIKDENKISNIYDSLKETQKILITQDAIKLYEYGNLILNFLNDFDFRKTVAVELLIATSKSNDDTDDIIKNTIHNSNIIRNNENKVEWIVPFL